MIRYEFIHQKTFFMKKYLLLFTMAIISCLVVASQDRIYRMNGKVIEVKVIEIGSGEVKYREYNNQEGPIYVLETDRIKKIVFEDGKEQKFEDNLKDPERYAGQRKKAMKLNFLSVLYGYSEIGFEKNIGYGKSFEVSLGMIGAGKSGMLDYYNSQVGEVKRNPLGFFISGGYKFGKLPDFILFGKSKASHLMQGTYVKPILYIGNYRENVIVYKASNIFEVGKQNITFGALQIELGKQWVLGDKFLLDIYEGFGYGFDNKKQAADLLFEENSTAFNYVNARLGKSPGLSYTFGIKLGWLIK
jgi:hypothetical protein